MHSPTITFICYALLLTGCVVGPDYKKPEVSTPQAFKYAQADGEQQAVSPQWWEAYGDAELSTLIEQGTRESPDLAGALARVRQAAAVAGVAESSLFPNVDFFASAVRQRTSGNTGNTTTRARTSNRFSNGLGLDWEVDLWGRVRRLSAAADADAQAEARNFEYALITLQTRIAETYFEIRILDRSLDILRQTVEFRSESAQLVRLRAQSGLADEFERAQAETELSNTQAELKAFERRRALAENALALLVGTYPSGLQLATDSNWQAPTVQRPNALPSDLLLRRPDIIEAESLMRAAAELVGATQTEYLPRITLSGELGVSASTTQKLYERGSLFTSLGPSVSWNLLNAGLTRSRIEQAKARLEELQARYQTQILTAFGQVENALVSLNTLDEEIEARKNALDSAARSSALARERYRNGLVSYLEVIDSERALLNASLTWTQALGTHLKESTALIRALGGGWQMQ